MLLLLALEKQSFNYNIKSLKALKYLNLGQPELFSVLTLLF